MAAPELPAPYRLVYSEAVKRRLRELADAAFARGDGPAFTAALKEFDRRLRLYPQFGDQQLDLAHQARARTQAWRRKSPLPARRTGTRQQR